MPASPASALVAKHLPVREIQALGRRFDQRAWVLGTSGNFSVVIQAKPLRLLMTASSVHKGRLTGSDLVVVDERGQLVRSAASPRRTKRSSSGPAGASIGRRPSAEALLHLEIVRRRGAGAVLHTHSVWGTVVSARHHARGGVAIEGYEMLKGLEGIGSHEHHEWLPILDNSQDLPALAQSASAALTAHPGSHAFLIHRHGLYTWGSNLSQAERHVEILEFLLEVTGREG
jgi:methylthioribulose-1-phosphate dehydratase